VTGDGKEVAHAKEALGARETATLEFPRFRPALIYEAKLAPDDALALDNVAYATAGSVKNVSISSSVRPRRCRRTEFDSRRRGHSQESRFVLT